MDPIRKLKIVVLFLVAFALFGAFVSIANSDELYDYEVYGQNKRTGLTVAGHMWEQDKEGNLKAKVWGEFNIHEQCFGAWIGRGVAQVGCENGIQYVLIVLEE